MCQLNLKSFNTHSTKFEETNSQGENINFTQAFNDLGRKKTMKEEIDFIVKIITLEHWKNYLKGNVLYH